MEQKYTSRNTSINKNKIPKIYAYQIPKGKSVLDYGCGKYTEHIEEYANRNEIKWKGYDKYNREEEDNQKEKSDYVFCSNVLNVIAEDEIVDEIINECISLATKEAVFTVYEGDRTGKGRQTGKDQYQRNEKKAEYVKRIHDLGFDARTNFIGIIVPVNSISE